MRLCQPVGLVHSTLNVCGGRLSLQNCNSIYDTTTVWMHKVAMRSDKHARPHATLSTFMLVQVFYWYVTNSGVRISTRKTITSLTSAPLGTSVGSRPVSACTSVCWRLALTKISTNQKAGADSTTP